MQREVERASRVVVLPEIVNTSLDEGDELDALAKLPESEQRKLAERAKAGEKVTARHVAHLMRRRERERELAAATEAASKALGKKLYGVIYIDPPWPFAAYNVETSNAVPDNHYPTMPIEKIKALAVPSADNATLFLWSTSPILPVAFDVMRAWGFTYKSAHRATLRH